MLSLTSNFAVLCVRPSRYTTVPQYAPALVEVCTLVCDLYGHRLGRNVRIDELYVALHKRLMDEIDFQVRVM